MKIFQIVIFSLINDTKTDAEDTPNQLLAIIPQRNNEEDFT